MMTSLRLVRKKNLRIPSLSDTRIIVDIYMCVCVCVCVFVYTYCKRWNEKIKRQP